jgi:hypothetical protein
MADFRSDTDTLMSSRFRFPAELRNTIERVGAHQTV